ncbi:MAG TPA: MOSC domain-containing protein [Myxococcota bacterium]|jgi:MOSC domain-containing protein YiiM|nr:MOSC domain-containing protein [Myxococcota bacterium]
MPRDFDTLEAAWQAGRPPPRARGSVRLICLRKGDGVHETVDEAHLTPEFGVTGDRWSAASHPRPAAQVTLMNVRAAELVTGAGALDARPLHTPGDNFLVDFDLCEEALPVGARLRLGGAALLEVSALPHTGCGKFSARCGVDALRWVNAEAHAGRRLRGVNCRVLAPGRVRVGDPIEVFSEN